MSLQEHANKLIQQKHFDKENIRAKLVEVLEKRENIVTLCTHKLNLLKLNLLHARFEQDAAASDLPNAPRGMEIRNPRGE